MKWLAAFFIVLSSAVLFGCVGPLGFGQPVDYSGATDTSLIVSFLEQGVMNTEGVNLEYNPHRGDTYSVSSKSCSGARCVLQINMTIYYMSFYDKVLEIEAIADYVSSSWSITDYTVLSETTVRREM